MSLDPESRGHAPLVVVDAVERAGFGDDGSDVAQLQSGPLTASTSIANASSSVNFVVAIRIPMAMPIGRQVLRATLGARRLNGVCLRYSL